MRTSLLVLMFLLLAQGAGAGATPSAHPTGQNSGSALPGALATTGSPTGQPSAKPTLRTDDTDDDKLYREISHGPFQSAKKIISTLILIPSILAGFLLSVFLSRLIWRKKSTAFDSLVLAMTLWQLLLDLMLMFYPPFVAFNVPKSFCGSRCRIRVMAYRSGDDGYNVKNDDDVAFGRYDVFDIELQLFIFLRNLAYEASAIESTIIVFTAVCIVFWQVRPQVVLKHFVVIQLAIFLLSLVCPLVFLVWWFDAIPGKPPFNVNRTREASESSQRFATDVDASGYAIVLASILINAISCSAIYWKVGELSKATKRSSVKNGVLLELSKRLAWFPLVQFHLTATPEFQAVDFLRVVLLSSAGLTLAVVYFRFSPRGWQRFKEMLKLEGVSEKYLEPCVSSLRSTRGNSLAVVRRSLSSFYSSSPNEKASSDHIPPTQSCKAEAGAGHHNSSTKSSRPASSRVETCIVAKDLDDDELLALLELDDESEDNAENEDENESEVDADGGDGPSAIRASSVDLSGVYFDDRKNSLRLGDNPLHRLTLGP